MSSDDYINLPNNKKIYIQDKYSSVDMSKLKKNHALKLFSVFDKDGDGKLKSSEIKSIFDSLKESANSDGNNELSMDELKSFIRKYIKSEYDLSLINPKEVIKVIESIIKQSRQGFAEKKIKAGNIVNDIFPELSFLELGKDNNIDYNKLSTEELKKHYPTEKYDIQESSETINEGSETREVKTLKIINKENGKEVLTRTDDKNDKNAFYLTITDENSGKNFTITAYPNTNRALSIISFSDNRYISIKDGVINQAENGNTHYWFDEGILESKKTNNELTKYNKKGQIKEKKSYEHRMSYKEYKASHKNITSSLEELIKNCNVEEFSKIIEESVNNNDIGLDMDNYYEKTGRELTEDIKNSNLPEDIKERLLNMICGPFIDSSFYDAHKKIENSVIKSDNYTSTDEYSVEYNGPIIMIYNKTSGETNRINLKTLLKDYDLSNEKTLKTVLKNIQKYSGEMLENISKEIETMFSLTKKDAKHTFDDMQEAGRYESNTIFDTTSLDAKTIAHEMAHGMDNEVKSTEYHTAKSKFKAIYDSCILRYEREGNKRFDNYNIDSSQSTGVFDRKKYKGDNYATYNEKEAFAICVQILYGYEDNFTLFIHDQMPELIDAARELYLEIRKLPENERK